MKKTIVNLGLMLVAFAIGITINNACAGSLENMSDSELRSLVVKMQQDIKALQSEVSDLKSQLAKLSSFGGSGSGIGQYGFVVDGIHFNPNGMADDKIDYYTYKTDVSYDSMPQNNSSSEYEYHYSRDSKGRVIGASYDTYTTTNGNKVKTGSYKTTLSYQTKMRKEVTETTNNGTTIRSEVIYHFQ